MENQRRNFFKKVVYTVPVITALGALITPTESNANNHGNNNGNHYGRGKSKVGRTKHNRNNGGNGQH